jgi:hypothetical protein
MSWQARQLLITNGTQTSAKMHRRDSLISGSEHPAERPVLTVAEVFQLAELVGRRPVGNVRQLPGG